MKWGALVLDCARRPQSGRLNCTSPDNGRRFDWKAGLFVIPGKAGIQALQNPLDPGSSPGRRCVRIRRVSSNTGAWWPVAISREYRGRGRPPTASPDCESLLRTNRRQLLSLSAPGRGRHVSRQDVSGNRSS